MAPLCGKPCTRGSRVGRLDEQDVRLRGDRVRVLDVERCLLGPADHHRTLGRVERRDRAVGLQGREVGRRRELKGPVDGTAGPARGGSHRVPGTVDARSDAVARGSLAAGPGGARIRGLRARSTLGVRGGCRCRRMDVARRRGWRRGVRRGGSRWRRRLRRCRWSLPPQLTAVHGCNDTRRHRARDAPRRAVHTGRVAADGDCDDDGADRPERREQREPREHTEAGQDRVAADVRRWGRRRGRGGGTLVIDGHVMTLCDGAGHPADHRPN